MSTTSPAITREDRGTRTPKLSHVALDGEFPLALCGTDLSGWRPAAPGTQYCVVCEAIVAAAPRNWKQRHRQKRRGI